MVVCIVAGAFAIFTPLLNILLLGLLEVDEEFIGMVINAKTLFFNAFLPGGDLGLIMPILIIVILCKDFSYGTVRNKIISGKTRTQIFFSMFFTATIFICAIMLAYAVLTLGVSLIFVEYQATPFTIDDLWYLLFSVLLEMITYVCISAIVCFLVVFAKNIGLSIVLFIAVSFLFSIIGSIVQAVFIFADPSQTNYAFLEFLNNVNIFTSTLIGSDDAYTFKEFLYIIIPPIVGTGILTTLGALIFNKKDLK